MAQQTTDLVHFSELPYEVQLTVQCMIEEGHSALALQKIYMFYV